MLLIKNGRVAAQDCVHVVAGDPIPEGRITVSLKRYQEDYEALAERNAPIGVRLEPADDPYALENDLDRLDLIEVSFPKYTDGRGYSQAQLLRRRLGYQGELRAVGDVLRDQLLNMQRSGFDAFELANADEEEAQRALSEFAHVYQAAADDRRTVFELRHGKEA